MLTPDMEKGEIRGAKLFYSTFSVWKALIKLSFGVFQSRRSRPGVRSKDLDLIYLKIGEFRKVEAARLGLIPVLDLIGKVGG